jgi:bifunctional DNase/RNase
LTDVQPEAASSGSAVPDATASGTPESDTPAADTAAPDTPAADTAAPDTPAEETSASASFRVMDVEDVSIDLPSQYPSVTLVESEPPMRTLVFPVGLTEGTAMAQALRRIDARRPMTHERFVRVLQRARIEVIAVRLVGREEGTYLAELDLMTPGGRERVDCRPSDGIVLALRMPVPAPILADERLLEETGDVAPA